MCERSPDTKLDITSLYLYQSHGSKSPSPLPMLTNLQTSTRTNVPAGRHALVGLGGIENSYRLDMVV